MKIYFAGPLFTAAEREFNKYATVILRAKGHDVFLPQESEQGADDRAIFESDVRGIDGCDVILASMEGRTDPDSGTCWEVGYAYALKKKIVLWRSACHAHQADGHPYNLMMRCSSSRLMTINWDESPETFARCVHLVLNVFKP